MFRMQSVYTHKWALLLVLILLLTTTALAAAQSSDLHMPLITGEGNAVQEAPEMPVAEEVPVSIAAYNSTNFYVSNRVGVGTDLPAHRLSVIGGPSWTSNGWLGAIELSNGSAIGWRPNSQGYGFGMGHTNGGLYIFRTTSALGTTGAAATYDFTISNAGRVGIGTITPHYRLHVKGTTLLEGTLYVDGGGIFVDGRPVNVPDYVFEPDYDLMPLDELRAYIAAEKHLPNVPSEKEIRAGRLDLTDFQMKLLEKTEELTLYTLAQDEQIKSLEQENHTMQQTNQAQADQLETLQQENQAMQQMMADMVERLEALEERE